MSTATTAALMFILRSTNSSHSIYNNARFFKRHTLHSTSVSRLRASPLQKFHVTDFFSATHRDAMRRDPRRHWQLVGPFQRFRRRFDNIPSNYLLFGILGINGAVFAAWSYVQLFQVRPTFPSTSWWLTRCRARHTGHPAPGGSQDGYKIILSTATRTCTMADCASTHLCECPSRVKLGLTFCFSTPTM